MKSTNQTDNNAAKTIALDHLGVIAARLRSTSLKFKQIENGSDSPALRPLDEVRRSLPETSHVRLISSQVLSNANMKQLERLIVAHQEVVTHLSKRSPEDQAYEASIHRCFKSTIT